MKQENEVYAAIAMALHEHAGNNAHDVESCQITSDEHATQWNGYALSLRVTPQPKA